MLASLTYFFRNKRKNKKKESRHVEGRGGAVKVFRKNTTRFFLVHSGQWQLAVGCIEDFKNGDGNEGGDFF